MKTLEEEEEKSGNEEVLAAGKDIKIIITPDKSGSSMETVRPDDGRAPLNLPKTVEESDFTELRNCSISRRSSDSDSDGKIRDYLRHLHPPLPHEGSAKYSGATGEKSDYHDRDNDKKQPTLEKMFRALRKPSIATLEIFNNFSKVSSNSRRGSHATISNSRRHSQMEPAQEGTSRHETSLLVPRQTNRAVAKNTNRLIIRRPSGAITFNPDQMNVHQRRYIIGLLRGSNNSLPELCKDVTDHSRKKKNKKKPCSDGNDSYISAMSALYANLLCVLGIAFPVTEVLSPHVPTHFYQSYYLYLYMGSLVYMIFMYCTLLKDRAVFKIIQASLNVEEDEVERIRERRNSNLVLTPARYGSFYLRLGAVAFGIGSMVYSGLEFGEYFELNHDERCQNIIRAITPVSRMILTLVQMQFIFLSSRKMEMSKYRGITKFGLMHMIATNLCEWLNVIVEETKHEILHLAHLEKTLKKEGDSHDLNKRDSDIHGIFECRRANVMGSLVRDTGPFLFPCTIEYSLICAVILYELWKDIKNVPNMETHDNEESFVMQRHSSCDSDLQKSTHFLSVDCSNAHKGLFSGILVVVMTIISLIMFFVMAKEPVYHHLAVYEVNVCELIVYCITTMTVIAGGWQMRYFKYKLNNRIHEGIGLDNILLMWAQTGTYIYCMFSIIACYFMIDHEAPGGFITEMCALVQTTCQTAFILDATFRRTNSVEQHRHKPGRQIVTFLLVANMTLWLLNTLQKNKAEYHPTHLEFYGVWAWTIITHVSMPLAIFYRFHSTICLFEIWKDVYKFKQEQYQV
ncbi:hypothetical protein RUM43_014287 [Polyplax serrata]|uniref:Uncharacterized protein n=1 Tax=Polyplax serrata TaxID=468196 RepID=A0AAN8P4I5_POLSC